MSANILRVWVNAIYENMNTLLYLTPLCWQNSSRCYVIASPCKTQYTESLEDCLDSVELLQNITNTFFLGNIWLHFLWTPSHRACILSWLLHSRRYEQAQFLATWAVKQHKHNIMYMLTKELKPNISPQLSQIAEGWSSCSKRADMVQMDNELTSSEEQNVSPHILSVSRGLGVLISRPEVTISLFSLSVPLFMSIPLFLFFHYLHCLLSLSFFLLPPTYPPPPFSLGV